MGAHGLSPKTRHTAEGLVLPFYPGSKPADSRLKSQSLHLCPFWFKFSAIQKLNHLVLKEAFVGLPSLPPHLGFIILFCV